MQLSRFALVICFLAVVLAGHDAGDGGDERRRRRDQDAADNPEDNFRYCRINCRGALFFKSV